jgi:hypothetical protein
VQGGRFVSAPLPRLSPSPRGSAILHVGGVSSDPQTGPKATRQLASPTAYAQPQAINLPAKRAR